MPQRIFKRKSSGRSTRNSDSSTEDTRTETTLSSSTIGGTPTPKCEATIPNRVFIGGIASNANEWDIRSKFASYGNVRAVKIIRDQSGVSKGYGFVTFGTEEEAKKVLEKAEVVIKGRKLNIAPAIKKQTYRFETQSGESSSAESRPESVADEQSRIRLGNYNFIKFSERQGTIFNETASYPNENSIYMDSGMFYSASEYYRLYPNPQVNCLLSYPTVVYIPQQPHQYPTTGITYPLGTTFPEMIQLVATPPMACCICPE